jgi:hypothetical protein
MRRKYMYKDDNRPACFKEDYFYCFRIKNVF